MGNQKRQRPCLAKRTMSIKKVMYVIFFTNQGLAIQIAVPKGKSVIARYNKGNVLHELKKYFLSQAVNQQLVSVVSGCCTTMFLHTKRPLYANIWNRKRLLSFCTLLISSPGRSPGRAIVLPLALALVSVLASAKC